MASLSKGWKEWNSKWRRQQKVGWKPFITFKEHFFSMLFTKLRHDSYFLLPRSVSLYVYVYTLRSVSMTLCPCNGILLIVTDDMFLDVCLCPVFISISKVQKVRRSPAKGSTFFPLLLMITSFIFFFFHSFYGHGKELNQGMESSNWVPCFLMFLLLLVVIKIVWFFLISPSISILILKFDLHTSHL